MKPVKMEQIWPENKDIDLEEMACDVSGCLLGNPAVDLMINIMSESPLGRKLRVTFDNGQVCTYKERSKC